MADTTHSAKPGDDEIRALTVGELIAKLKTKRQDAPLVIRQPEAEAPVYPLSKVESRKLKKREQSAWELAEEKDKSVVVLTMVDPA